LVLLAGSAFSWAVASLVELNAVDLITQIGCVSQTQTAGKSIPVLLNEYAKANKFAVPDDVAVLLAEVSDVLEERHAVAHGLWTVSLGDSTFCWRPVVAKKRVESHIPTVGDTMMIEEMRALIVRLVDLSARLKSRQAMVGAISN
jgi:hypothetical protein